MPEGPADQDGIEAQEAVAFIPVPDGRGVWMERVWMMGRGATLARANHWAVWVEDISSEARPKKRVCYEVGQESKVLRIDKDTDGRALVGSVTFTGTTTKTDQDIAAFNAKWREQFPEYNLLTANCQKYARDLAEFLVGGSYEPPCPLPEAGTGSWRCPGGSHVWEEDSFKQCKKTSGKVGGIWGIFGFEAEGPKWLHVNFGKTTNGNWGHFVEAALFRLEVKMVVRLRLEPNLHTGLGHRDRQLQARILGFGLAIGNNGVGVSTPLGGLGIGKF
jgi:hypothetical protein